MLLLSSGDVSYCNVTHEIPEKVEKLPGLSYQNKLFVKGESYSKAQEQEAIRRARQAFSDAKGEVLCLVVADDLGFTIWYQNNQVQPFVEPEPAPDIVATINLEKLVDEMRDANGIKIKDRWYNLRSYPKSFVGSEAVNWFKKHFNISTQDALRLGQRLIEENWLHHVADQHPFRDGNYFYRFYIDEIQQQKKVS